MIVVDTNVIAYLFLPGDRTSLAQSALRKDPDWVAPFLWRSEFRNVLALFLRREELALDDALQLMSEAELLMSDREYSVDSDQVLKNATVSGCSSYDCEFVVLAKALNLPLVTVDKKILTAFPSITRPLSFYA